MGCPRMSTHTTVRGEGRTGWRRRKRIRRRSHTHACARRSEIHMFGCQSFLSSHRGHTHHPRRLSVCLSTRLSLAILAGKRAREAPPRDGLSEVTRSPLRSRNLTGRAAKSKCMAATLWPSLALRCGGWRRPMTSWEKSLHVLASPATPAQEEDDTPPWATSLVSLRRPFGGTDEAERGNSHFFLTTLMRGQGCPRKR